MGAMFDMPAYTLARMAEMSAAHQHLEAYELDEAAALLRRASPFPSDAFARGQRLVARLIVRSGGDYSAGMREHGLREKNLAFATHTLEALNEDPRTLTDLGEAYYRQSDFISAHRVLKPLAERDLITTAEGWAALGDMERCRRMARKPEVSCGSV